MIGINGRVKLFLDPQRTAVEGIAENDISYDFDNNALVYDISEDSSTSSLAPYIQDDITEFAEKAMSHKLRSASEEIYSLKFSGDDWEEIYAMGWDQEDEPVDLTSSERVQLQYHEDRGIPEKYFDESGIPIEYAESQTSAVVNRYLNSR